jgi:DNA-binding GntR family transcriptional regulator
LSRPSGQARSRSAPGWTTRCSWPLTSLYDDLAASGRTPATQVLKAEVSHASDQVAEALLLPERTLVMSLERIRLADGEPMALMHNYLPAG